MRRLVLSALIAGLAVAPAAGDEIASAYSDFDINKVCTTYAAPAEDEGGDWANMVCDGYRGYPVFLFYSDARESLFYGFPPAGDVQPTWESFQAFNNSGEKIEWRLATKDGLTIPFATIHRWFVTGDDPNATTQVLVVEKVGQPGEREGCVVGYVVATGNPNANEKARRIADGRAREFVCGGDEPSLETGSVALPAVARWDN